MPQRVIAAVTLAVGLTLILWLYARREQKELDVPAVVRQVQQLNQLTTVRYTVQKVVGVRQQKQPLGSESILLILQAHVEAGVDLSQLRSEDVKVRPDGTMVFRIPNAKVLNVSVNEKETKVWDRQKTWWTPWVPFDMDLERRARIEGLDAIKKTALDMGILRDAERNADSSIRGLLNLAGVTQVVVITAGAS